MKTLVVVLIGLFTLAVSARTAESAGFASAYLRISSARLEKQMSPGVWVPATAGATNSDIPTFGASHASTTSVNYTGFTPSYNMSVGTFDSSRSFLPPTLAAIIGAENDFGSQSSLINYGIADTSGSGSLITPGGALVETVAGLSGLSNQIGAGSGRVSAGGSFVAGTSGMFRLALHASVQMEVSSSQYSLAEAGVGFGANINTVGVGGGLLTDLFPSSLNQIISGNGIVSFLNQEFVSLPFALVSGHTYSFNINQGSIASISAVPEPTSLAIVSVLVFGGFAARRIRREE